MRGAENAASFDVRRCITVMSDREIRRVFVVCNTRMQTGTTVLVLRLACMFGPTYIPCGPDLPRETPCNLRI